MRICSPQKAKCSSLEKSQSDALGVQKHDLVSETSSGTLPTNAAFGDRVGQGLNEVHKLAGQAARQRPGWICGNTRPAESLLAPRRPIDFMDGCSARLRKRVSYRIQNHSLGGDRSGRPTKAKALCLAMMWLSTGPCEIGSHFSPISRRTWVNCPFL